VVLAGEMFAQLIGIERLTRWSSCSCRYSGSSSSEHLVPQIIVRRGPQDVLEILLPSFDVVALCCAR
jgi:hypothetical protein